MSAISTCMRWPSLPSCPRPPSAMAVNGIATWRSCGAISCSTRWWRTISSRRARPKRPSGRAWGWSNSNGRVRRCGVFPRKVRRQLIDQFGETADDGRNSVYSGGLWVRTSLDVELQDAARDALRAQLISYHGNRGFTGPIATLNPDNGDLTAQLASSNIGINYRDWRVGVVTAPGRIGFSDGEEFALSGGPSSLKPGDVVAAARSGGAMRSTFPRFRARSLPKRRKPAGCSPCRAASTAGSAVSTARRRR